MASGTFDLLHLGHIYYLKESKKLGDELVVVVACDATVRNMKHEPVTPQEMRVAIIGELKTVDQAILGGEKDMYAVVDSIQPDIIALGYDQVHDEKKIVKELKKRQINVRVVRLQKYAGAGDLQGTRKIIEKIIAAYEFQKKIDTIEKT